MELGPFKSRMGLGFIQDLLKAFVYYFVMTEVLAVPHVVQTAVFLANLILFYVNKTRV